MSKKRLFFVLPCFVILFSVTYHSCIKDVAKVAKSSCDSDHRYSTVILPMMQTHCATPGCHDGSGGAPLDLTQYNDLKTFYDNGQLESRVITMKDMPPTGALPDSLIQKLSCWMAEGAPNN